ncbi:MAG: two component transcriptional regulator, LuxR family [Phycisphaerales bacterium]|jgi:two-component system response regulator NreC|nr:two component transcriptional regulator, LuxR family [Phycisphaerales bacterium]
MKEKIRVLLADDHAVLRAGLRMLIDSQPDMLVSREASDGREAVTHAGGGQVDVAVVDLSMPAGGGVRAIEAIRARCPDLRVLVLSMHNDAAYVRTALAAGANGYVAKAAADTELLAGIRAVHRGKTFIDPALAGTIVSQSLSPEVSDAPRLSERERQVLEFLARGHTNQEIANRLFLSVKTAETYRARLSRKLGLKNRADFVRYGLESGILTRDETDTGAA